mgnify:CR=1 FL=1
MENYKKIIEDIYLEVKNVDDIGKVANYIPELAFVNSNNFGINITTINNESFGIGDFETKFSIQSVTKILSLTLAYKLEGEKLWERVDVEPSGNPFNSLLQLEADLGKPRNPFINAGAIVVCDVLISHLKNPKEEFLNLFSITPMSEELFNYWLKNKETEPIEKALRFLFLSSFSYLGKNDTFMLLHSNCSYKQN